MRYHDFITFMYQQERLMSAEPEFQAHYQCSWCKEVRQKDEIIFVDDKPICKDTACKEAYYNSTKP